MTESHPPKSKALKPFWIILVALGVVIITSLLTHLLQAKERIPWRSDLAAATVEAQKQNKPLFLYFTASWCEPCQRLKTTTWADPDVESALAEYVPVKIDIDEHPEIAKKYPSDGIPHFVVLQQDGSVLKDSVGAVPSGEFIAWLTSKK